MKSATWFLLVLLTVTPLYAKPKVNVKVKVSEGASKEHVVDKLGQGNATPTDVFYATVWYLNVTVTSDNADAVSKNNGQWCLSGDAAPDPHGEYDGVLDGNGLDIQVPGKNGKIKKMHFEVYAHEWKKLSDIK